MIRPPIRGAMNPRNIYSILTYAVSTSDLDLCHTVLKSEPHDNFLRRAVCRIAVQQHPFLLPVVARDHLDGIVPISTLYKMSLVESCFDPYFLSCFLASDHLTKYAGKYDTLGEFSDIMFFKRRDMGVHEIFEKLVSYSSESTDDAVIDFLRFEMESPSSLTYKNILLSCFCIFARRGGMPLEGVNDILSDGLRKWEEKTKRKKAMECDIPVMAYAPGTDYFDKVSDGIVSNYYSISQDLIQHLYMFWLCSANKRGAENSIWTPAFEDMFSDHIKLWDNSILKRFKRGLYAETKQ